jgi:cytochrome P450
MASTAPSISATAPAAAEAQPPSGRAELPPGPRAPALLQTLGWALAPTWVMDQCARRLGDSFTITFFPSGMKLAVVSEPEAVKTVFTAPPELAPSGTSNSPVAPIVGPSSVLVLTGPEHMRQRKLLLPPFHGERMREYEDVIVQATRRDMASWPVGSPMQLLERTRAITLEVILRAVFGVEAERMDRLRDAIAGLLKPANTVAILLFALRRPQTGPPTGAIARALERLDGVIYEELARRREQPDLAERSDILSLLLQARDEDGEAMTDAELRDELVTLLLAGHETTATSVAWAIERLARHPQKLERLVAEIDAEADGGPGDYMTAVVNETLRVRPVVPIVVRVLQEEMRVGAYNLPAGTRVTPSIYLTNRNPKVYENPAEFRPERFLDGGPETFSWIPFGGGIRRCIGASFALYEMRIVLQAIARSVQLRAAQPQSEPVGRRSITLTPRHGAQVVAA